jgi:hypothetical protein
VGHVLLTQVENEIRARGGRLLIVETSATPAYGLARRLYETSGYQREAVIRNFYAPGDDLMVYVKDVRADPTGEGTADTRQGFPADMSVEVPIWPKQVTAYCSPGEQCGSLCAR